MKKAIITLWLFFLICGVIGYFYSQYSVPILMYHRIGEEQESSLFVSPQNFQRQMEYLYRNKYQLISLDELVEGIKRQRSFAHKTVVITFDDGYRDVYERAFPVLKKYNFPAIIFLVSGYIGQNKDFLSWEQVRQMRKEGIDFGGHSRHHSYLPLIKEKSRLGDEILGCKREIEENLGEAIFYFCYPTGGFNKLVKQIVRESGYKGACTTNRGLRKTNTDVYELKRIKITNSDMNRPLSFRAKLSGYYNLFRRKKEGD